MPTSLLQLFSIIAFISTVLSITNSGGYAYSLCQDDQKALLLELKDELIFNSSISTKLVDWNQTDDCCRWKGVGCSSGGHVTSLQLDYEGISGGIESSSSLVSLEYLEKLSLAHNSLKGSIPSLNLSKLVELDLSSNQLKGPIPDSFFVDLDSLEVLSLSHNFHDLTTLDLSQNLSLAASSINSNWSGFSQLKEFSLASCNLQYFPEFIKQSNLNFLDLSDNQITGEIPSWIWEIGKGGLYHLNLSYNFLVGIQKPYHIPSFLAELDLHSNRLRGELPLLPRGASYVDFSDNRFDMPIPLDLVSFNFFLIFLSIANNSISGSIPTCICSGDPIQVLDMSNNNLSGSIPPCIVVKYQIDSPQTVASESCTSLWFVNVARNMIEGGFPCMLPSRLKVLVLRSNKFDGEVKCGESWLNLQIMDISYNNFRGDLRHIGFSSLRTMMRDGYAHTSKHTILGVNVVRPDFNYLARVILTSKGTRVELDRIFSEFLELDFSCNGFQGEIPEAIGDLSSLRLLNLSHNALTGRIPRSFGNMAGLEALDLSANQLAETIPAELADLIFLAVLNLSNNQLVGEIPNGGQLNTFAADSFEGNRGLCGFNLNVSCTTWKLSNDAAPWKVEDGALMYLFLTFLAFL